MNGSQPFNGLPLHIDCPTGVAGDMLLAALLDLGVPEAVIEAPLADLGLAGFYQLRIEERRSAGLRGLSITVRALEPDPPHRQWADIRQRIEAATLDHALQQRVLAVFEALAEAEAAVHGTSPDSVHFHEVGAMDALVDVVGVCAAMEHLAPLQITCTAPPAGHGSVKTAHGRLPVPVPAVLELARRHQIPLRHDRDLPPGELTTPTGLALLSVLVDQFSPPHRFTPGAIGIGLGHRELDRPNLLRLIQLQSRIPAQESSAPESDGVDLLPRWQPLVRCAVVALWAAAAVGARHDPVDALCVVPAPFLQHQRGSARRIEHQLFVFVLVLHVVRAFRVEVRRFSLIFLGDNRAVLHRFWRKIGAPSTRDDRTTCA